ncbi:MAG: 3-keto-disaccharide hydrolase [Pirellulales bacterium]
MKMTQLFRFSLCLAMAACMSVTANAADDLPVFTTVKEAGQDYKFQGEYQGTVKMAGKEVPFGAQIIALGDGKFHGVGYPGGLPGEGWKRGDEKKEGDGELKDGKVTFIVEEVTIIIAKGKLSVVEGDQVLGTLKKVTRTSPTMGAKPPKGAIVLFDGSNADEFEGGQIVQENLLLANTFTKRKFKDHSFHLEFRTPFKPKGRGQARGNSGVYVNARYEVQVLDSFGLKGENNECGGIYQISVPKVNMCYPPLTWQTYDIDFTAPKYDDSGKKTKNARVTVIHNGFVIHDNLELPKHTPGRHQESPAADEIYLQGHGNPVVYRNIWVVEN